MKKFILAFLAYVAGIVVGRPTSGRWLAHYFMGSGKDMTLPRKMEHELVWLWNIPNRYSIPIHHWRERACREMEYVPEPEVMSYANGPFYISTLGVDTYTTVGDLVMWIEDGYFHYVDVYNWQESAAFEIHFSPPFLPFDICISGKDHDWLDTGIGEVFVTRGKFPVDLEGVEPKEKVERLFNTSHNEVKSVSVYKWLRKLGFISAADEAANVPF